MPLVSAAEDYFMQARCKAALQAYDQGDRTNTITALWKCQKVVYSCTDPETGALPSPRSLRRTLVSSQLLASDLSALSVCFTLPLAHVVLLAYHCGLAM